MEIGVMTCKTIYIFNPLFSFSSSLRYLGNVDVSIECRSRLQTRSTFDLVCNSEAFYETTVNLGLCD